MASPMTITVALCLVAPKDWRREFRWGVIEETRLRISMIKDTVKNFRMELL